jgi:hypothetical protein
MAAVLSCGEGAALSHRSAAAFWQIGVERAGRIDVSVRRRCQLRRPGLVVRSRPTLAPGSVTTEEGISVTNPAQTLVDIATELSSSQVERAVNEADKRDLIDPETLRKRLGDYVGVPGAPALRRLLDKQTFMLSDSQLEVLFRRIAATTGLPPPSSRQQVNGFPVDFYWPELGLVVETDGLRYHRTASTQLRDIRRDRAHALAGMTSLRFTHYEVKHEPHLIHEELNRAVTLLRQRG